FGSDRQVSQIAAYLRLPGGTSALDVSGKLVEMARDSLVTFGKLLDSRKVKAATYAIYRDYIRTLLATVSTRFMSTTEVAKPLTTARDEL
ncbi:hypothetical protein, partial [Escherichia coli]|uniref:hypothetical protein n=1 Tax=Escherichia coli TaxID=562 RepID=UPI0013D2CB06